MRGGSWNNNPQNVRVFEQLAHNGSRPVRSNRNRNEPTNRNNNIGFRCAGYAERGPGSVWGQRASAGLLHGDSGRANSASGPLIPTLGLRAARQTAKSSGLSRSQLASVSPERGSHKYIDIIKDVVSVIHLGERNRV